ncbi:uncharacterized protein VTP21DRAFT_7491 [Calcarisporiella thermophila]|uniref:uncharacterized protein n=1 Tax=Calcarisporiella thermophila TaxID=911321 RepID=UPI0037440EBA
MSDKPIVVVAGATGAQGGSVARALLQTGKYHVRAITRNPDSEKARQLATQGAEVVKGNLSSIEDMRRCFTGAYAVYAVTNPYDPNNKKQGEEFRQGKNMADAALAKGVQHYIWSTLISIEKSSGGKFKVEEFDAKERVEEYVKKIGLPATFVNLGSYYENFIQSNIISTSEKGDTVYIKNFIQPSHKVGMLAASIDTGKAVVAILSNKEKFAGKYLHLSAKSYTFTEFAEIATKVSGIQHVYSFLSHKDVNPKDFPFNPDLFEFFDGILSEEELPGLIESRKELGIEWLELEDYLKSINYGNDFA